MASEDAMLSSWHCVTDYSLSYLEINIILKCFIISDQLPQGFSDTLEKEENKIRPKFDHHVIDQEMPTSSSVTKGTPDEMPDVV